jgi:cyclase
VSNIRLIGRLDIKGQNLIKGVHLEGLRVIGKPADYALRYYEEGIDELIYMDSVASLYGRNHLGDLIQNTVKNIFIPITVGGGIRTLDDAKNIFRAGADKIAINTQAVLRPSFIHELTDTFGSQSIMLSIEAKKQNDGKWHAYTHNGREGTGLDVLDWAQEAVSLGVGEILLTSIDREGTRKGFELELIQQLAQLVKVPLIASGGMGEVSHMLDAIKASANAVAMADILHRGRYSVGDIRAAALDSGLSVRKYEKQKSSID